MSVHNCCVVCGVAATRQCFNCHDWLCARHACPCQRNEEIPPAFERKAAIPEETPLQRIDRLERKRQELAKRVQEIQASLSDHRRLGSAKADRERRFRLQASLTSTLAELRRNKSVLAEERRLVFTEQKQIVGTNLDDAESLLMLANGALLSLAQAFGFLPPREQAVKDAIRAYFMRRQQKSEVP